MSEVQRGYGTLIPDEDIPISGILHESDVHHRLAPQPIIVSSESWRLRVVRVVKKQLRLPQTNTNTFRTSHIQKIGTRKIPIYAPGYMSNLDINREYTRAGWFYSGVSVTHVVSEAERIAGLF